MAILCFLFGIGNIMLGRWFTGAFLLILTFLV